MNNAFFNAIKNVSGPATLIAYMAALAAWAYVAPALARLKANGRDLAAIPEKERIIALRQLYGPIPDNITAAQWIRNRRMNLFLIAFIATLAATVMTIIWVVK
jgi:hypothetical protein